MNERAFKRLGSHERRNNFANVSATFVSGTSFPMVVFGAPPPVTSQPSLALKLKGRKRATPTPTNTPVGDMWSDVAIANIIDL